jgi:hypothetical protein
MYVTDFFMFSQVRETLKILQLLHNFKKKIQKTLSSLNKHIKVRLASESSSTKRISVLFKNKRIQKHDVSVGFFTNIIVGFFSQSKHVCIGWQSDYFLIRGGKFEILPSILQNQVQRKWKARNHTIMLEPL